MVEIKRGDSDVTETEQLTLEVRRDCDVEYVSRASAFIRAKAQEDQPFFVYFNHSMLHMPVIPRTEFLGRTGEGEWADSLLELDQDFGSRLFSICSTSWIWPTTRSWSSPGDNGPEEVLLWRGTPGYWEGSYFSGSEGNLRTPCIARWPEKIPSGQVSDDIMHVTDWFTTLLRAAGTNEPSDRQIDGMNQLPWLLGENQSSRRDGYIYWMGPEMYGVKWRNFKLVLISQKYSTDAVEKLSSPRIVNLTVDPKEREPLNLPYMHSWTVSHFNRLISAFHASAEREPLVPLGSPLEFIPGRS
jgi:hypothetical protein